MQKHISLVHMVSVQYKFFHGGEEYRNVQGPYNVKYFYRVPLPMKMIPFMFTETTVIFKDFNHIEYILRVSSV